MNAVIAPTPVITQIRRADLPLCGALLGGGYFTDLYRCGNTIRALITAPKADNEAEEILWTPKRELVAGAMSFTDSLANTDAMAAAGSEIAIRYRALRIGGADDWCIPALDVQQLQYRAFKPTADENACWSGCNINSIPPSQRYLLNSPGETTLEAFKEGGPEAFETDDWYWSSTQYAGLPHYAWGAFFVDGGQSSGRKGYSAHARPVRSLLVID